MPLLKSNSKKAISFNIREMMKAGHPRDQSVAAALSTARKYARKAEGGGDLRPPLPPISTNNLPGYEQPPIYLPGHEPTPAATPEPIGLGDSSPPDWQSLPSFSWEKKLPEDRRGPLTRGYEGAKHAITNGGDFGMSKETLAKYPSWLPLQPAAAAGDLALRGLSGAVHGVSGLAGGVAEDVGSPNLDYDRGQVGWTPGSPALGDRMERDVNVMGQAPELGPNSFLPATKLAGKALKAGVDAIPENSLGIVGGKGAATANLGRLNEFNALRQKGVSEKKAYQQTGWFIGADGNPNFWIPDYGVKLGSGVIPDILNPNLVTVSRAGSTLEKVWPHSKLFDAYPELKNIPVKFLDSSLPEMKGIYGYYNPTKKEFAIRPMPAEEFRKTIAHETTHAIQNIEGFHPGGNSNVFFHDDNPELIKRYNDFAPDFLSHLESHGITNLDDYMAAFGRLHTNPHAISDFDKPYAQAIAHDPALLQKTYKFTKLWNEVGAAEREAYKTYKNTAGESQARDTEKFLDYHPNDLARFPPKLSDVEQKDINVRNPFDPTQVQSSIAASQKPPEKAFGQYFHPYDFNPEGLKGIKQTGPQQGSTPGGMYQMPNGEPVYIKTPQNPEQAYSEKLATELYRAAGVQVPDNKMTKFKGKPSIVSPVIPGQALNTMSDISQVKGLAEHYPIDLWLGNTEWNGAKNNKVIVTPHNEAYRLNMGAALSELKPTVHNFYNNPSMWKIMGGQPSADWTPAADRLRAVTDQQIHDLVEKYGPMKKGMKPKLEETLKARRDEIATMYGTEEAKPSAFEDIAAKMPKSSTYGEGLENKAAQPLGVSTKSFQDDVRAFDPTEKWTHYDALHDALAGQQLGLNQGQKEAVSYWTNPAGYKDLNGYLRGANKSQTAAELVPELDSAMAAHPLQQDTVAWRGLHGPHADQLIGLKEGDTFFNAGYTATTIDPRRATHYGKKNDPGIILNYHMPAGSDGLYTSHPDAGGWSTAERELLLPHGQGFKITGIEKIKAPIWDYTGAVSDTKPHNFTVYHVEPIWGSAGTQLDAVKGATSLPAKPAAPKQSPSWNQIQNIIQSNMSKKHLFTGANDAKIMADDLIKQLQPTEFADKLKEIANAHGKPFADAVEKHLPQQAAAKPLTDTFGITPEQKAKNIITVAKGDLDVIDHYTDLNSQLYGNEYGKAVEAEIQKQITSATPKKYTWNGMTLADPDKMADALKKTPGTIQEKIANLEKMYGKEYATAVAKANDDAILKDVFKQKPFNPDDHPDAHWGDDLDHPDAEPPEHLTSEDYGSGSKELKFHGKPWFGKNTKEQVVGEWDTHRIEQEMKKGDGVIQILDNKQWVNEYRPPTKNNHQPVDTPNAISDPAQGGFNKFVEFHHNTPDKGPSGYLEKVLHPKNKHLASGTIYSGEQALYGLDYPFKGYNFHQTGPYLMNPKKVAVAYWPNFFGQTLAETGNNGLGASGLMQKKIIKAAHDQGVDLVVLHGMNDVGGENQTQYLVINNKILRAKDAKFDPAKFNASAVDPATGHEYSHTMWGIAGASAVGAGLAKGQKQDEDKKMARGGKVKEREPQDHEFINFAKGGMIESNIPGRTDKIPMKVATGAYVLPADIPSALGQGNTIAGKTILDKMFNSGPYGLPLAKGRSQKFQMPRLPHLKGFSQFAQGGRAAAEKALPADHQLGMKVPKGGSMCASCSFYKGNGICGNKGFAQWNGSGKLPQPADEYCCDLYAHQTKKMAEGGAAGDDYNTQLSPEDEVRFQAWKQQNMPLDSGVDYDQRGAYLAQFQQQANGHWQDQFKKPNHPTFSDQSQYAVGDQRDRAGNWFGDQFIPPANKKQGGGTDHTPIIAAGGEYILNPDTVMAIGHGSMTAGHRILDAFTLHVRKEHIKTLRGLKGPK